MRSRANRAGRVSPFATAYASTAHGSRLTLGRRRSAASATFRKQAAQRGLEPDECYSIGLFGDAPDLAIEIAVSRWKIDKLDVYRGLGVREVWVWRDGAMTVHVLDGDRYVASESSALLPALDLELLSSFVRTDVTQLTLVKQYRGALRHGA